MGPTQVNLGYGNSPYQMGIRSRVCVTVDESVREIERSEDEEESEDNKSDICQLLKPMDGVSAQRQVLRALALEV